MNVSITIDDSEVRSMLNRMPERIEWAMRAAMNDATSLLLRDMKTYPTPPAASTYTQTGTLGGSWTKEITGSGINITGRVGSNRNEAPYNRYVQDATLQARVHQGRWQTVQSVTKERENTVRGFFETRLRQAAEQL
jgi:hypothetical protein